MTKPTPEQFRQTATQQVQFLLDPLDFETAYWSDLIYCLENLGSTLADEAAQIIKDCGRERPGLAVNSRFDDLNTQALEYIELRTVELSEEYDLDHPTNATNGATL